MSNDVFDVFPEDVANSIDVGDVPEIISSSIDNISKLERQVRNAEESASKAMDYVSDQMTRYEEKGSWIFKRRSGNTKDIIEDTQEAVENLAAAQQVSVSALTKSFEFQKKLAETSRYLFQLGCANVAINRIAVRAIELKLSGASKSKLSELARQEMLSVVKQLKEQEDILKKQEALTGKVKEHGSRLDEKDSLDTEQTRKIELLDSNYKLNKTKISEISEAIDLKDKIDSGQDQRIEEIFRILNSHDSLLKKQEVLAVENKNLLDKCSSQLRTIKMLLATSVLAIVFSLISFGMHFV